MEVFDSKNPPMRSVIGVLAVAFLCPHSEVAKGQLPALEQPDLLCRTDSAIEIQHDNSDLPLPRNSVGGGYYFATPESAKKYLSEAEKATWDVCVSRYFYGMKGKREHWQYQAVMRRELDEDGSEKRNWMAC